GRRGRTFVARRLGGRGGPQERPLHADRQRQAEGREEAESPRVGPTHEERLARPQPRDAALEARPRAQRGDRRAPRREIPQQLLRRDRPQHPRPPPRAAPEQELSDETGEQEAPAHVATERDGGAARPPSRVEGALPREVGRAPPPPGRGRAAQSIRPAGSRFARERPPDPATTHAPPAPRPEPRSLAAR